MRTIPLERARSISRATLNRESCSSAAICTFVRSSRKYRRATVVARTSSSNRRLVCASMPRPRTLDERHCQTLAQMSKRPSIGGHADHPRRRLPGRRCARRPRSNLEPSGKHPETSENRSGSHEHHHLHPAPPPTTVPTRSSRRPHRPHRGRRRRRRRRGRRGPGVRPRRVRLVRPDHERRHRPRRRAHGHRQPPPRDPGDPGRALRKRSSCCSASWASSTTTRARSPAR